MRSHARTARRALAAALALGGLATTAEAYKAFGPPSRQLAAAHRLVTVVTAEREAAPGRFAFARRLDLVGQAPERFEVRFPQAAAEVRPGAVYVLGHSSFLETLRFPAVPREDPEGASVLDVQGVGPALFPDDPAVRTLVTASLPPAQDSPAARRALLGAVAAALARPEPRVQRLGALELFFRRELHLLLQPADLAALRAALDAPGLDPLAADFLLRAAVRLPPALGGAWVAAAARGVLARQPGAQLDLASPVPALLHTALGILARSGSRDDAAAVSRFLAANNAAVAEAALRALQALAPETALARAREALARPEVEGETRRLLARFVEREGAARQ